uniref:Coiled-coil domain-containing protein 42 homolog n=1 Tax=Schistocephalus solidus TaxID=70667 RepID=A0A0X3PAM6_SCHSO
MNAPAGEKILLRNPQSNEPEYLSSASKLFLKRRENQELSKLLSNEKDEHSLKLEGLHKGFEELADKEKELELSLVKFDGFLRDNGQKRERAMKKIQAEEIKCRTLSGEIEKTRLELSRRIDKRKTLDKRLKYYSNFASYLSSVLAASEGYGEIGDLINRVEALKALKVVS